MDVQIQLNTFVNTTLYKMEDLYSLAERALDVAIAEKKFLFKIYDYLQHNKAKRKDAIEFLESSTCDNISKTIDDLNEFIKGGNDTEHRQIKEGYCFLSKPDARKISKYLTGLIDDAERYKYDHRPGRRKKAVNK